jgi:hypothetical protein
MKKIVSLAVLTMTVAVSPAWAAPFTGTGDEVCVGDIIRTGGITDQSRFGFMLRSKDMQVIYVGQTMGYSAAHDPGAAALRMGPGNQIFPYRRYAGVQGSQKESQVLESGEVAFTTMGDNIWRIRPGSYDVHEDTSRGEHWPGKIACAADLAGATAAFKALGAN